MERAYTTRRLAIVNALVEKLKLINGTSGYYNDISGNAFPKLIFWDDIKDFPTICATVGTETRVYQGGGFKERYLSLKLTCYVKDEESMEALESLLADIEACLEENSSLLYQDKQGADQYTTMITILSIDTDEGVMAPLGIGEILCEVRY
jgi:hypothetical protein